MRFLAGALGVTGPVTSPTFTLAHTYEVPRWPDRPTPRLIHHIDAYRLVGDADAVSAIDTRIVTLTPRGDIWRTRPLLTPAE